MGDYTKLIINCSISKIPDEDFEKLRAEFDEVCGLCSSAYHCGGEIFHIDNEWHHRTDLTIVTQTKYGRDLPALIEWIKPKVISGSGDRDCYAIAFWEHKDTPDLFYMYETNKET